MQILVVGAHRSGTSALAGILHHLGVDMGPMADPEASAPPSNPLGQFEDNRFVRVFNKMIGNWRDPVIPNELPNSVVDLMKTYIQSNRNKPVWGLKTPQLCFTGSFMLRYLDDPFVIFIQRAFDEVVASLAKRDNYPTPVAQYIASRYRIAWEGFAGWAHAEKIPHATLGFNSLYDDTEENVRRMANLIYVRGGIKPRETVIRRAIAHIHPDLRHHDSRISSKSKDEDVLTPPATESSGLFDPLDSQAPTTS